MPQEYIRAVEAGCRDALGEGPLGGHRVTGLRVTLTDGSTHVKDSSEQAFRTAGRFGLREALRSCAMVLLEPVAEVTVTVPDDALGTVLGDLAARRGRVTGSTTRTGTATVTATVPLAELFGYATRLRSRTPGPRHLHGPPHRLRPGPGTGTGRPVAPAPRRTAYGVEGRPRTARTRAAPPYHTHRPSRGRRPAPVPSCAPSSPSAVRPGSLVCAVLALRRPPGFTRVHRLRHPPGFASSTHQRLCREVMSRPLDVLS
ncbi:hypothetical protein GCM10020256_08490 [Streptomyces thermocoprophilus]